MASLKKMQKVFDDIARSQKLNTFSDLASAVRSQLEYDLGVTYAMREACKHFNSKMQLISFMKFPTYEELEGGSARSSSANHTDDQSSRTELKPKVYVNDTLTTPSPSERINKSPIQTPPYVVGSQTMIGPCIMECEGDYWKITYNGSFCGSIASYISVNMLAILLENPNNPYTAQRLYFFADLKTPNRYSRKRNSAQTTECNTDDHMASKYVEEDELYDSRGYKPQRIAGGEEGDKENLYINDVTNKIKVLKTKRDDALKFNSKTQADKYDDEIKIFEKYLDEISAPGPYNPSFSDNQSRGVESARRNFRRLITKILSIDKNLSIHLDSCIFYNEDEIVYRPEPPLNWDIKFRTKI